jgi:hypothetical protein
LVEPKVETLLMPRVVGFVLSYEDLNNYDDRCQNPMLAVLVGKLRARRSDCAPLAGKALLKQRLM